MQDSIVGIICTGAVFREIGLFACGPGGCTEVKVQVLVGIAPPLRRRPAQQAPGERDDGFGLATN